MSRLAVLALLLLAPSAHAALPDYEVPAMRMWGVRPASVEYRWFDRDPWGEREVVARAYCEPDCVMWLSRPWWLKIRRVERCRIFVHEWGHLVLPGGDYGHVILNRKSWQITKVCRAWERERWARRTLKRS